MIENIENNNIENNNEKFKKFKKIPTKINEKAEYLKTYFSNKESTNFENHHIDFSKLKTRNITIIKPKPKLHFTNEPTYQLKNSLITSTGTFKRWKLSKRYKRDKYKLHICKKHFNKDQALSLLKKNDFIASDFTNKNLDFKSNQKFLPNPILKNPPIKTTPLNLTKSVIKPIFPIKNFSFIILKKITHPLFTGPLEVYCNYVPGTNTGKVVTNLVGVTLTSCVVSKAAALVLNAPALITIGVVSVAENFLPDFREKLKNLPTIHELEMNNQLPESPILRELYVKQMGGTEKTLQVLSILQRAIKSISAQNIWDKLTLIWTDEFSKKPYPMPTEEFVGPPEKNLSLTYNNFSEQEFHLNWTFSRSFETGMMTATTEIPITQLNLPKTFDELIQENSCSSMEPISLETEEKESVEATEKQLSHIKSRKHANYSSIFPKKPKPLSFGELCEIKDLQLMPIGVAGIGVAATLAAYQTVVTAGASATGEVMIGMSVTLESGFMTAFAAGLVYIAPLAAALVAADLLVKNHQKKIKSNLNSNTIKSEKDLLQFNVNLKNFNEILERLNTDEVDVEDFINTTHILIQNFTSLSQQLDKRGMYADKHRAISNFYYLEKDNILQIIEDLKKIVQKVNIQNTIQTSFLPQIQSKKTSEIIFEQKNLISLRSCFISKEEAAKQAVIKQEIMNRTLTLEDIELIIEMSLGNYIELPLLHFAPKAVDRRNINSGKQKQRKNAKQIMRWAGGIEKAYIDLVLSINTSENKEILLQNIAKLLKTIQEPCIQLKFKNIINSEGQVATNPQIYYQPWLTKVNNSLISLQNQILDNQENNRLFTKTEITSLQYNTLLRKCVDITNQLTSDNNTLIFKEKLFNELKETTQLLHAIALSINDHSHVQEAIESIIIPTLKITQDFASYEQYQKTTNRLTQVQNSVMNFIELFNLYKNTSDDNKKAAVYNDLTNLAYGIENLKILETELNQISSKELYPSLTKIKNDLIIKDYKINVVPKYEYIWNFALHLMRDTNRYEGKKNVKSISKILQNVNSLAPQVIASLLTLPEAITNGHLTYQNMLLKHEWTSITNLLKHPYQSINNAPNVNNKLIEIQKINNFVHVAIQTLAKINGPRFSPILNASTFISESIDMTIGIGNYAHIISNLKQSIFEKQSFNDISSISNMGAIVGFKAYNYLSRKPNRNQQLTRWKSVNSVSNFFKNRLPDFSEYLGYHMFLDVFQLGAAGLALFGLKQNARKSTPIALAIYKISTITHKLISGQYRDSQIEAINTNCINTISTTKLLENKEFLQSLKNLESLLGNNYLIKEKDTILKNNSRKFLFECHLRIHNENENFSKAIELTEIELDKKNNIWKFKNLGIDLFKKFQIYQERIFAIYSNIKQSKVSFNYLVCILNEIDGLKKFLINNPIESNEKAEFINKLPLDFISLYFSGKFNKIQRFDYSTTLKSLKLIEKLKSIFDFNDHTYEWLDRYTANTIDKYFNNYEAKVQYNENTLNHYSIHLNTVKIFDEIPPQLRRKHYWMFLNIALASLYTIKNTNFLNDINDNEFSNLKVNKLKESYEFVEGILQYDSLHCVDSQIKFYPQIAIENASNLPLISLSYKPKG